MREPNTKQVRGAYYMREPNTRQVRGAYYMREPNTKQVIKMKRRGESLSDTDYCKSSQTSNKNDEERRRPL